MATCVFLEAQTATISGKMPLREPQPLLRIERLQSGEAVCALVQEDGTYRLEKLVRAKGDMYTGTTAPDQVDLLRRILAEADLRKLSQESIKGDMMTDTLDSLDVAIWRERGWQVLSFRNPSSRRPFKDALDPLLKWFQDLQKKRPSSTKIEGSATRCLPPKELQAQTQPPVEGLPVPASTPAPFEPAYLFRFESSEFSRGILTRTCTVLFSDGTYRLEKRTESIEGSKTDRGYRGRVNTDSLTALKNLLDSQDLKNAVSDSGKQQWAQNVEKATLSVPRENGIQRLEFASEFNTLGDPRKPGGMSNLGYHTSSQKLLDPLKRWMNQHTNKQEGGTAKDETVNDCLPVKTP
jgi:hypothetical protein